MTLNDTIAAVATGVGGAVAIVRISGPEALRVGRAAWTGGEELEERNARRLLLGRAGGDDASERAGDPALAVYMPGPNSYTGDDVVEIHCHGGVVNTRGTLALTLRNGARAAEPGEFTYRAFVNGKMDLTQAEAVGELISAHSDMASRLAERQLDGRLGDVVRTIRHPMIEVLAECESRLDFPEEDLDWTSTEKIVDDVRDVMDAVAALRRTERDGMVLREGVRVVIAGKPNVGKSSLLNELLGVDRAIVTALPGTTRDTIEEFAHLRGVPVRLIDTAGIREVDDAIEGEGVARTLRSMRRARIVLWLLDASADDPAEELSAMDGHVGDDVDVIVVWNKIDMAGDRRLPDVDGRPVVRVSVLKRKGLERLLDVFEERVWGADHVDEPEVAIGTRHAEALDEVAAALPAAVEEIQAARWELAAVHLHSAIDALGRILGDNVDPDVLDSIFSKFCVGK